MNHTSTHQLDIWNGTFGAEYTDRNNRRLSARKAAWHEMVADLDISRVLEVGCNIGWNLTYLSELGDYQLVGIEPQSYAVEAARNRSTQFAVMQGSAFELPFRDGYFDLVFTSGVLIHIHPRDLRRAIDEIYRVSRRYVLYIEYDAPAEQIVPYRGQTEALWKRDHRAVYQQAFPDLKVVRHGFWSVEHDYDDCTWYLFEKPAGERLEKPEPEAR